MRTTYPSGKGEFKVVCTECVIVDSGLDDFFEELVVAEEIFCDTKPHAEQLE
jgi:hypothetical protein